MTLELHDDAALEVQAAYEQYEKLKDGLGIEFVMRLDAGMEQVRLHPKRWAGHIAGTRRYRIQTFPYGIVYDLSRAGTVLVVAVMHLSREPGYWIRRLPK